MSTKATGQLTFFVDHVHPLLELFGRAQQLVVGLLDRLSVKERCLCCSLRLLGQVVKRVKRGVKPQLFFLVDLGLEALDLDRVRRHLTHIRVGAAQWSRCASARRLFVVVVVIRIGVGALARRAVVVGVVVLGIGIRVLSIGSSSCRFQVVAAPVDGGGLGHAVRFAPDGRNLAHVLAVRRVVVVGRFEALAFLQLAHSLKQTSARFNKSMATWTRVVVVVSENLDGRMDKRNQNMSTEKKNNKHSSPLEVLFKL